MYLILLFFTLLFSFFFDSDSFVRICSHLGRRFLSLPRALIPFFRLVQSSSNQGGGGGGGSLVELSFLDFRFLFYLRLLHLLEGQSESTTKFGSEKSRDKYWFSFSLLASLRRVLLNLSIPISVQIKRFGAGIREVLIGGASSAALISKT